MEVLDTLQQHAMLPDVINYTPLISACEKGIQAKQAAEVFGAMQQHAIMPNVITYSVLISTCE